MNALEKANSVKHSNRYPQSSLYKITGNVLGILACSDMPYHEEFNSYVFLRNIELEVEETKETTKALICLLKEEGFKAGKHPHPRRDVLIKTRSGEIVITKSKRLGYLVDYIGKSNESFSVRGLNTYEDVITCLNNEFYKSQA